MKSSVTFDSATSVTSSWCLPMSWSSRSKGPSNTSRRTWKPSGAWAVPVGTASEAGSTPGGPSLAGVSDTEDHPEQRRQDAVQHLEQQQLTSEREHEQDEQGDHTDVLLDEDVPGPLPAVRPGRQREHEPPPV